jgi:hypothetical protein
MKALFLSLTFLHFLSLLSLGQIDMNLMEELQILQPLSGKSWVGQTTHSNGKMTLHYIMKFEPTLGGKALKFCKDSPEIKNISDGYFYFNAFKKQLAFFWINSNGTTAEGVVEGVCGNIHIKGYTVFANYREEFSIMLEITSDGNVIENRFLLENGDWKKLNSVTFSEVKPSVYRTIKVVNPSSTPIASKSRND